MISSKILYQLEYLKADNRPCLLEILGACCCLCDGGGACQRDGIMYRSFWGTLVALLLDKLDWIPVNFEYHLYSRRGDFYAYCFGSTNGGVNSSSNVGNSVWCRRCQQAFTADICQELSVCWGFCYERSIFLNCWKFWTILEVNAVCGRSLTSFIGSPLHLRCLQCRYLQLFQLYSRLQLVLFLVFVLCLAVFSLL